MAKEFDKLVAKLQDANIPHLVVANPCSGRPQVKLFADFSMTWQLDDCCCEEDSLGGHEGLLETYRLGNCQGYETAETVFRGWQQMYENARFDKPAHCTIIGAGGEVWTGSAPSWD